MSRRKNKVLRIGAGICAVILILELVWLSFGLFRFAGVSQKLKAEERRLSRLHTRDPYPSEENKMVLEENLDELDYRVGELSAELNRDPGPENIIEPAELSAFIQTQVERFGKNAQQAGVELPDTLEAGFAQYASGGRVAAPADVSRLMRQLHSVVAIGDVLVNARVASINKVSRDLFEGGGQGQTSRRRRSDQLSGPKESGVANPIASEIGPASLYLIERIGITFSAKESAVWGVLQGIASAPQFMVVQEVSHQTASRIMDYSPRAIKRGTKTDDDTLNFLKEGVLRGENALSRPERIIAGNELVQVRLIIDVYHFGAEGSHDRQ